ncbi:MAG: hypothetical protein ACI4JT_06850 [Oscillospiraceae bacterium]
MKKVVSLLLVAVLLFTLSFSCFAASSAIVGFTIDSVLSVVSDNLSTYSASIQKRVEAARGYYFYKIINDDYSSGLTVFDSSGYSFTDDILKFYFNEYFTACSPGHDLYDSNGDVFIQAAGFPNSPFSLSLLSFAEYHVMQQDDGYDTTFLSFKNYYNSFLARYLIAQGETATDPNPGKSGLDIAPGYVSSEELVEGIEKDNSYYTPKGELGKISYRTDDTFQKWCQYANRKDSYQAYIIDNNRFVNVGGSEDLYFQLFILYDDIHYVSEFQFHLFFDVDCTYDDSGTVTSVAKYPRIQCWSNIDGDISEPVDVFSSTVDCSEYKYFFLGQQSSPGSLVLKGYKTYSDFIKNTNSKSWYSSSWPDHWYYLYNSDLTQTFEWIYTSHYCAGTYDYHVDTDCDRGLYVSSTPIDFTYRDIDTTKIPANQIITINGDTIYNYTITNPETGDSSKFGDYITNNYTYITNNYGGSESGGSSGSGVAGNVTVGGSIDVGGSVGVDITVSVPDININVNGNGGAGVSGSSIANPDDFTSADEVDLTKYYDEAVEQSTGFQKFLKDFFGFLPAELLGVILFAVAMAIVCRVFGR